MDRRSFSDNEMFYAMFDWCSSKVRCHDVMMSGNTESNMSYWSVELAMALI